MKEKVLPKDNLCRPWAYTLDGKYSYIKVPMLDEDKELNYVIEFTLNLKKGPSRHAKVLWQASGLGEPSRVIIQQAWNRAYAVFKEMERRKSSNGESND